MNLIFETENSILSSILRPTSYNHQLGSDCLDTMLCDLIRTHFPRHCFQTAVIRPYQNARLFFFFFFCCIMCLLCAFVHLSDLFKWYIFMIVAFKIVIKMFTINMALYLIFLRVNVVVVVASVVQFKSLLTNPTDQELHQRNELSLSLICHTWKLKTTKKNVTARMWEFDGKLVAQIS